MKRKLRKFHRSRPISNGRGNIPDWFYYVAPNFEKYIPYIDIRALQIGAFAGDFSKWLMENRTVIYLDDVDTWEGSEDDSHEVGNWKKVRKYYLDNVGSFRQIKWHKKTSDVFFSSNKCERSYNFIYIDGSHQAKQVLIDGLKAFDRLEDGGILVFDDYEWNQFPDPFNCPKLGIDTFLSFYKGSYKLVYEGYQIWIQKIPSLDVRGE